MISFVSLKALKTVVHAVKQSTDEDSTVKAINYFLNKKVTSKEKRDLKKASVLIYFFLSNFETINNKKLSQFLTKSISISDKNKLEKLSFKRSILLRLDPDILAELKKSGLFLVKTFPLKTGDNSKEDTFTVNDYKHSTVKKKIHPNKNLDLVIRQRVDILNNDQQKVISAPEKSILVVSNPGVGKTTVLVERASQLLLSGNKLLLITFTVKAAEEMKERIRKVLQRKEVYLTEKQIIPIECKTFHSWAYRIVIESYKDFGFTKKPSIIDDSYRLTLIYESVSIVNGQFCFPKSERLDPKEISKIIGFFANREKDINQFFKSDEKYRYIRLIYNQFSELKRKSNLLDFDDLMELVDNKLREDVEFRQKISCNYDHILVDEVQDCNNHQFRILKSLSRGNKDLSVFACGDDKQSIYGFRSSDYRNMSKFVSRFKAAIYYLNTNYRSSQEILDLANISARYMEKGNNFDLKDTISFRKNEGINKKQLPLYVKVKDVKEQSNFIVNTIKQMLESGIKARDIVVLYRTNSEISNVIGVFNSADIPFERKNSSSKKEPYINDFMELIQMYDSFDKKNLWERFFFRFIVQDKRECNKIYNNFKNNTLPLNGLFSLQSSKIENKKLYGNYRKYLKAYITAIKYLKETVSKNSCFEILSALSEILAFTFSSRFKKKEESVNRILFETVSILSSVCRNDFLHLRELLTFDKDNISELLSSSNSAKRELTNKYGGKVTLSTIHGYKGLEADTVFIANCVEGNIPLIFKNKKNSINLQDDEYSLEEERRLFYVACTRAKNNLIIVSPLVNGKRKESRFITEIKNYLVENKIKDPIFRQL